MNSFFPVAIKIHSLQLVQVPSRQPLRLLQSSFLGWISWRAPRIWKSHWRASRPGDRPARSSWWRPAWGSRTSAPRSSWCGWNGPFLQSPPGLSSAPGPGWLTLCLDDYRENRRRRYCDTGHWRCWTHRPLSWVALQAAPNLGVLPEVQAGWTWACLY